ncbi:MAG: 16S rRNA (uracil(1498)-N(3))-methyltransferase [Chloroflexi bacterium]|nr:16S rRNA (uracil(1498)-N(3))-methyltransferase [Chloroflexota bacterium]
MQRFFVSPETLARDPLTLEGPVAYQLIRVLRARPGEHILLLDGSGRAVEAELVHVGARTVTAHPLRAFSPASEPHVRVTLYVALPKGKRLEWVLQKGTEVGVTGFVPMITERCVIPRPEEVNEARLERWRQIIREAAEQAGRARLPTLAAVRPFAEVCVAPPEGVLALILSVGERARSLRAALASWQATEWGEIREVRLYIGPEGGFSPQEVALAAERGIRPVTLGPRILRVETAAIVAPALVLYELGECL